MSSVGLTGALWGLQYSIPCHGSVNYAVPPNSGHSYVQRDAGAQAVHDAGKGTPVFQLVPTEALGKKCLDMGDPRRPPGQEDRIHLDRGEAGARDDLIDARRNLLEIFPIEQLELPPADILTDVQVLLRKADRGLLLAGKLALGLLDRLKEKRTVIIVDDILQVLDGRPVIGSTFDHPDMLPGLAGPQE